MKRLQYLIFSLCFLQSYFINSQHSDTIKQIDVNRKDYFQHYIGYLYVGAGVTPYKTVHPKIDYFHNDFRGNYDFSGQIDIEDDPLAFGIDLAAGPFGEKNIAFYPVGFSYHKSKRFRKNRISSGLAINVPLFNSKKQKQYPDFWMEIGLDLAYHFYKMSIQELRVSKGDPVLQSFDPYFHNDTILKNNGIYQLSAMYGHLSIEPMISLNYRITNNVSLRFVARSSYNLYEERLRLKFDYKPRWGIESEMEVGDFYILPTEDNFHVEGEVIEEYPARMIPYNFSLGLVFRLKSDLGRAGKRYPRYRPN